MAVVGIASAGTYTFTPNPSDLDDLDHKKYYSWGINWQKPTNEVIVEAVLKIKNIWDWQVEEDHLYTHLLNNPDLGVKTFDDDESGGDNWAGQGPLIGVFSDPLGGEPQNFDLIYKFSELGLVDDLTSFLSNNRFGFGFDPECHYFNDGIKFTITTQPVPEPAAFLALGLGVAGIAIRRSLRKKA